MYEQEQRWKEQVFIYLPFFSFYVLLFFTNKYIYYMYVYKKEVEIIRNNNKIVRLDGEALRCL